MTGAGGTGTAFGAFLGLDNFKTDLGNKVVGADVVESEGVYTIVWSWPRSTASIT